MPNIETTEPKVKFVRGADNLVENYQFEDGQLLVTENGYLFFDDEDSRQSVREEIIKAVYDKTIATASHSVREYIYVNNLVYRVTTAIAIGDTITVGTNVELANDLRVGTKIYISNLPSSTGGGVQAVDVGYDNTESGLIADDVQGAIDELASPQGIVTVFNQDGSITQTYANGNVLTTTFNQNGSITEILKDTNNVVIYTKTTTFNQDGSITEEVI